MMEKNNSFNPIQLSAARQRLSKKVIRIQDILEIEKSIEKKGFFSMLFGWLKG